MKGRFYRLKSGSMGAAAHGDLRTQAHGLVVKGTFPHGAYTEVARGDAWGAGAKGLLALSAVAVVLAAPGCATAPAIEKDIPAEQREKIVAERAEARWRALIAKDVPVAYTFLSPGSKASVSLDQYRKRIKPGIWKQAKAQKVTCDGDICNVTINITYDTERMKGIETQLAESWIIEKGNAWYVYR